MFKVTNSENRFQKRCTPNILPCHIHHDGPVDASPRYWAPEIAKDGKPEAYFRGRRLRGQEIEVPQGCRGVIVKEAGKEKAALHNIEQGDLEGEESEVREEEQEEITLLNEVGSFDKLLIWNHESMVEGDDAFVKGLCEWIGLAEAVSQVPISADGDTSVTLADMVYRLDACPRRRDLVRLGRENCRCFRVEVKEAKRLGPSSIAII